MNFIEIAEGGVRHRGIIIKEDKLQSKIDIAQKNKAELYYTVWTFDNQLKEHFKHYQTIRSFRGKASLNYIIFDIDKGQDTDDFVLRRTQEFVRRLTQDWDIRPEELRIYYSGSGYHVYMPNYFKFEPSEVIKQEVKNTLKEHFPETDLSIYGATGLIRAPYSLNKKTNRYKIPLTPQELFSSKSEQIILLAGSNETREEIPEMEEAERDFTQYVVKATVERESVYYRDEPTKVVTCMQHLFNKGATSGTRHIEGMRLISVWRRQGVPKAAVNNLMALWATSMEKYELERMVNDIFDKGYRYGCNDHVMAKYCDQKCIFYIHKNYTAEVTQPDELEALLIDHAVNLPTKKFIDLDQMFKLPDPYRIYEGEMVVLCGDTKIGKSTLAQNIVANNAHIKWLYLPLEDGKILDGRRLVQIAHDMTKEDVMEHLATHGKGLIQKINHVDMLDTNVTLDNIRKVTTGSGVDYDAVVIDTADQVGTDSKGNYTDVTEKLAIGFRNLARTTGKIILIVHHISKRAGEDVDGHRKKLTIHGLKGASSMEQKADKVIAIEGNRDDAERLVSSLGARDESPFKKTVIFNKNTFRLELIDE